MLRLARISGILVQGVVLGLLVLAAVIEMATSSGAAQIFFYEGF